MCFLVEFACDERARLKVPVLHGASVKIQSGDWTTILGSSGSGKSTLLHLFGGLDRPDKDP